MGIQVSYKLKDLESKVGPLQYEELYKDRPKLSSFTFFSVTTKEGKWVGTATSAWDKDEVDTEKGTAWFSNKGINHDIRKYLEDLGIPYNRG